MEENQVILGIMYDLEGMLATRNSRDRAFADAIKLIAEQHGQRIRRPVDWDTKKSFGERELRLRRALYFASTGAPTSALACAIDLGLPKDQLEAVYTLLFG